jgi:hypothetical protein
MLQDEKNNYTNSTTEKKSLATRERQRTNRNCNMVIVRATAMDGGGGKW